MKDLLHLLDPSKLYNTYERFVSLQKHLYIFQFSYNMIEDVIYFMFLNLILISLILIPLDFTMGGKNSYWSGVLL